MPPARPQPPQPARWPEGSAACARQLHQLLTIGDRQWHAFKGQPQRRAAEQLAAALVLLLDPANPPQAPVATEQRLASIALLENGLAWLKGDRRDPGCPQHGPSAAVVPAITEVPGVNAVPEDSGSKATG